MMAPSGNGFSFTLCADDYALSPAVNRGILEALAAERLNATSVMTNMAGWRLAARDLMPFHPRIEVGLHLNLTLGKPLRPMPRFAPREEFPPIGRLIRSAYGKALPEAEIRSEITRQIDAFTEAFGRLPDYVDGHQHVQVLPGIRLWLIQCLEKKLEERTVPKGSAFKPWLRNSGDLLPRIFARGEERSKALMVTAMAQGFARLAQRHGFLCNDGFAGFSAFDPAADYAHAFAHFLTAPGKRHLVMCHPGHCDEELARLDPVTLTREKELAFLLSEEFSHLLALRKARMTRLASLVDKPELQPHP